MSPSSLRSWSKFRQPAAAFLPNLRSGLILAVARRRRAFGEGYTVINIIIDVVLFSCVFAFVTGIVIAAANLLI
jgi:hypothetical protein